MSKFTRTHLLFIVIFLSGCNRGIESQLQGKWIIDGEPDVLTVEFFKDGRVVNTYGAGATLAGTWKVISENTVLISMEPWEVTGELSGGKLILRSGDKEKVYCKVK